MMSSPKAAKRLLLRSVVGGAYGRPFRSVESSEAPGGAVL